MRFEHDAVSAELVPADRPWALAGILVLVGVGVGVALVRVDVALFVALLAVACGALMWVTAPPRLAIRVDARSITLTPVGGGRVRRVSLLDVHEVFAVDGRLLIEPQPGPLAPISLDARRSAQDDLERLAAEINAAVKRASHRGDAPDERTRAVQQLLREPE